MHPKISNEVAQRLGARSFRQRMLTKSGQASSLSLGNDVHDANALSSHAEAFGQRESLTRRLKHILELYPEGPGTLFEMVQNADDAKATEVIICLDTTTYGTSSLLSPKMSDWQGPALYVYNNAQFTAKDYYNIARIGQGSKLDKLSSTGRFGLGFNAVYHFSDVPSFVSGDHVVFLDPHCQFVPSADGNMSAGNNGGGLKINFSAAQPSLLTQFPDQFLPYQRFGCDCQQTFPGTLFRFPLRSEASAQRSEIKREAITVKDVMSLLKAFKEVAQESLLFLRHVNKITVKVMENGQNMPIAVISKPSSTSPSSLASSSSTSSKSSTSSSLRFLHDWFSVSLTSASHRQRSLWSRMPDLEKESKEAFYQKLKAAADR